MRLRCTRRFLKANEKEKAYQKALKQKLICIADEKKTLDLLPLLFIIRIKSKKACFLLFFPSYDRTTVGRTMAWQKDVPLNVPVVQGLLSKSRKSDLSFCRCYEHTTMYYYGTIERSYPSTYKRKEGLL